jgi:RpiB/LacA/LacB family sugar-phosphate isomerase
MKTIKDKQIVVGADGAGFPLKEAVVEHLRRKGWEVLDLGVQSRDEQKPEMFQRIGFKVGARIAEGEYERGLIFCGTGMGIHIAASKCPHVHAAVVESLPAAKRCVVANNCNIMSMGAFYVAPAMGIEMADAFLEGCFGEGYENIKGFYDYHKLAYDEIEAFDYEAFRKNGFEPIKRGEISLGKMKID